VQRTRGYDPEYYTALRALEGQCHRRYAARSVYLNENDDKRNLNVNQDDNDWRDRWSFAAVRNSLHQPLVLTRGFVYELFLPTAEHSASFDE